MTSIHELQVYIFVNKIDLVDPAKLKEDWSSHQGEIEKLKLGYRVRQIFFVSAKTTPQEQFVEMIKRAVINSLAEDNDETVPSAIIDPQYKMNKKEQKPKSMILNPREKQNRNADSSCCQ